MNGLRFYRVLVAVFWLVILLGYCISFLTLLHILILLFFTPMFAFCIVTFIQNKRIKKLDIETARLKMEFLVLQERKKWYEQG